MNNAAYHQWLAGRGIDHATLSRERYEQLANFWRHDLDEMATRPQSATDAAGAEVKVGDLVTITLRVTAIHHLQDDLARGLRDRKSLNLAQLLPGGGEDHFISAESTWVKKA